jgi:hypothetical protein
MSSPEVAIVLPLFGNHRAIDALVAVSEAWLRQDVECEVVVAVAGGIAMPPGWHDRADAANGRLRIVWADPGSVSAGPLRNLAAAATRAPLLYLGDADIAPVGDDFLSSALPLLNGGAVIQPWMYRLVNADELRDVSAFRAPGRSRVCHVHADRDGRLVPVRGERFTWAGPSLVLVDPPAAYRRLDGDGKPWSVPPFHWGGVLLDRTVFDAVGQYCTRYVGWGCEDDDLIAKLEGLVPVRRAWLEDRHVACVHFEHPRTHTTIGPMANRAILAQRLAAGVESMIEEDRIDNLVVGDSRGQGAPHGSM